MSALCQKTECDVRSCLNTVQFLAKNHAAIKLGAVQALSIGQKDMTKSAFRVWTDLFQTKVRSLHSP